MERLHSLISLHGGGGGAMAHFGAAAPTATLGDRTSQAAGLAMLLSYLCFGHRDGQSWQPPPSDIASGLAMPSTVAGRLDVCSWIHSLAHSNTAANFASTALMLPITIAFTTFLPRHRAALTSIQSSDFPTLIRELHGSKFLKPSSHQFGTAALCIRLSAVSRQFLRAVLSLTNRPQRR